MTEANGYPIDLVQQVIQEGQFIPSRYGSCIEILGGSLYNDPDELVAKANMNLSLGWMELIQVVAGVFDPEALKVVAPKANHSLFTYEMSYGPRIADQMHGLIEKLRTDSVTRQAILFVAKPEDGTTNNLPCTLTIQYLVRTGHLHSLVTMRSWDLCRGLPYDWMVFGGLQKIVAACLGLPSGILGVQAGSAHIYEDQREFIPIWSSKTWKFTTQSTEWDDWVDWANLEMPLLKKGGKPTNVEYTD